MIHKIAANALFSLHFIIVLAVLFGWIFPSIWYPYMVVLALTLLSDLVFGYCILSKWEFDVRKKIDPKIDYNYNWTSYYTYRFTRHRISDVFFLRVSVVFLAGSLAINLYFY